MKCILRGDFGSTIERAKYLNECNIPVCMEAGEIVFSSKKDLVEGLSTLYVNDMITDEELLINLKRYKTDKETNIRVLRENDLLFVVENNNKFLCISEDEEANAFYLVAMDATENEEKDVIKFNFQKGTQCYDIIDTLYKVDNNPVIQSEVLKDSAIVEIEKDEDSYTLNVIRKKDKTYISKYTSLLSFKTSTSRARMKYLYNELNKMSQTNESIKLRIK